MPQETQIDPARTINRTRIRSRPLQASDREHAPVRASRARQTASALRDMRTGTQHRSGGSRIRAHSTFLRSAPSRTCAHGLSIGRSWGTSLALVGVGCRWTAQLNGRSALPPQLRSFTLSPVEWSDEDWTRGGALVGEPGRSDSRSCVFLLAAQHKS